MTGKVRPKVAVLAALLIATTLAACGDADDTVQAPTSGRRGPRGRRQAHRAGDRDEPRGGLGADQRHRRRQHPRRPPAAHRRDADHRRRHVQPAVRRLGARSRHRRRPQARRPGARRRDRARRQAPATSGSAPTGFKLPGDISSKIAEPAEAAENGLTKTGAMFFINPHDWQKNAKLVGETTLKGEKVQHIKADVERRRPSSRTCRGSCASCGA